MFSKKDEGADEGAMHAARRRLNPELQKLVDNEEEFIEQIYEGQYDYTPFELDALKARFPLARMT